jgi:hypothetical protein
MFAAGDEGYIFAGFGQTASEITTNPAAAEHCYAHRVRKKLFRAPCKELRSRSTNRMKRFEFKTEEVLTHVKETCSHFGSRMCFGRRRVVCISTRATFHQSTSQRAVPDGICRGE